MIEWRIGWVVVYCSIHLPFSAALNSISNSCLLSLAQTARGGVNVMTEWQLSSVSSKLTLIAASSSDNGVYSCTVPGSGTDKVTLFIDEG